MVVTLITVSRPAGAAREAQKSRSQWHNTSYEVLSYTATVKIAERKKPSIGSSSICHAPTQPIYERHPPQQQQPHQQQQHQGQQEHDQGAGLCRVVRPSPQIPRSLHPQTVISLVRIDTPEVGLVFRLWRVWRTIRQWVLPKALGLIISPLLLYVCASCYPLAFTKYSVVYIDVRAYSIIHVCFFPSKFPARWKRMNHRRSTAGCYWIRFPLYVVWGEWFCVQQSVFAWYEDVPIIVVLATKEERNSRVAGQHDKTSVEVGTSSVRKLEQECYMPVTSYYYCWNTALTRHMSEPPRWCVECLSACTLVAHRKRCAGREQQWVSGRA